MTFYIKSQICDICDIWHFSFISQIRCASLNSVKSQGKFIQEEKGRTRNLWKSQWEFSSTKNTHSSKYAVFAHRSFNPTIYQISKYQTTKQSLIVHPSFLLAWDQLSERKVVKKTFCKLTDSPVVVHLEAGILYFIALLLKMNSVGIASRLESKTWMQCFALVPIVVKKESSLLNKLDLHYKENLWTM